MAQGCSFGGDTPKKELHMPGSVYKVIELVGTSADSWEDAAKTAVEKRG